MKVLNVSSLEAKFKSRLEKMSLQAGIKFADFGTKIKAEKSDAARFEKDGDSIVVYYDKAYEFFYGLFYALGVDDKKGDVKCAFDFFGVMLDCSKTASPTVETLEKFVDNLAFMGYNRLNVYVGSVTEKDGEKHYGSIRGGYTPEELTELDLYCKSYDIELNCRFESPALTNADEGVFALAVWKKFGFAPLNELSEAAIEDSFDLLTDKGVDKVFLSMIESDGGECSPFSLIPALCFASDLAYGRVNHELSVLTLTGVSKEDFTSLDLANYTRLSGDYYADCKDLLFADPFAGVCDDRLSLEGADAYLGFVERLSKAKAAAGTLKYVFETQERLCKALRYKYDLSLRTRKAYLSGDKKAIKKIIKKIYKPLKKSLKKLYLAFKYQWNVENKPFGFDSKDARFGGLMLRVEHCRKVLKAYVKGKIKSIPELDAPALNLIRDENCANNPFTASHLDGVAENKI